MKPKNVTIIPNPGARIIAGYYRIDSVVISPKCKCVDQYVVTNLTTGVQSKIKGSDIKTMKDMK